MPEATTEAGLKERVLRRRPATEAEKHYVSIRTRFERRSARGGMIVNFVLAVFMLSLCLWAGTVEDEPFLITFGVVFSLLVGGGGYAYVKHLYRTRFELGVPSKPKAVTIRGHLSVSHYPEQTYHIGREEVKMPDHWKTYLYEGDTVEAQIVPTEYLPYVVATSGDLAVEKEADLGVFTLAKRGQVIIISLILTYALLLLIAFLVIYSINGKIPSIEHPAAIVSLGLLILTVVPCIRLWTSRLRARSCVHRMYYQTGADRAISPIRRRALRVYDMLYASIPRALVGGGVCPLLGADALWGAALLGLVGAIFGLNMEEAKPSKEWHEAER